VKFSSVVRFVPVAALAACPAAIAQEPFTTMLSIRAIAANPQTGKVYAADSRSGVVTIFNSRTNSVSHVRVGAMPIALAVNSAANRIYVANFRGASLSVIDGVGDSVVATLPVGERPYAVAVNPATNKIYVSNQFSDTVRIIDGATNAVSSFKAGSFNVIATDSKLGKVYLLGYEDTDLKVLGDGTVIAEKISVGMHQWAITVNENASALYVTRIGNAELVVIEERSSVITKVPTGAIPCAVEFNSATNRIYVVNHGDDTVTVVDAAKLVPIATVRVGHKPQGLAIDRKANRIYVANRNDKTVTVIDGTTDNILKTVPAPGNPFALSVDESSGRIFAALVDGTSSEITGLR
jgi:YVTN family beta-propeller protein